jgi:UDP-3-O-[3-hydroxymyristoyl] glucosamine N-acyltransferase
MIDPRFHKNHGPFKLGYLATLVEGKLKNSEDQDYEIQDVASLGFAEEKNISFFHNIRYKEEFINSKAGACIVSEAYVDLAPPTMRVILSPLPYRSYGLIASAFYPEAPSFAKEISPHAFVDPTAKIGKDTFIGPGAVVSAHSIIGDGVCIHSNSIIGEGVEIGDRSTIGANSVLSHCLIGQQVFLYPGVKIGQPGFGFFMDRQGHIKIPQLGRVIIHDNVEIGANSTVDRGATGDTVIGRGTMIDNLVQVGHNVHIGKGCVIVAQVGIAGSTHIGNHVVIGGQVGIAGHLNIGNNVRIAAQSGVIKKIEDNSTVAGSPAVPVTQWHRQTVILGKLAQDKK